jgi:mediator of RNA polymerase II transcription subunit 31
MSSSSVKIEAGISDKERLQIEFEFVQNLSNPAYLHFLAQNRYLQNEKFLNFLKYLEYWMQPEYAKHLVFPQCLAFLDALNNKPDFRQVV